MESVSLFVRGSIVFDGCMKWEITRRGEKITTIKSLHPNCKGISVNVISSDIGWIYKAV